MSRASIWSCDPVRSTKSLSSDTMSNLSGSQREEYTTRISSAENALRTGVFSSSQLFLYLNDVVLPREQFDSEVNQILNPSVLYQDYISSLDSVKRALCMLNQGNDPKHCLSMVRSKYMLFARI
jgi:hypothetical protein